SRPRSVVPHLADARALLFAGDRALENIEAMGECDACAHDADGDEAPDDPPCKRARLSASAHVRPVERRARGAPPLAPTAALAVPRRVACLVRPATSRARATADRHR